MNAVRSRVVSRSAPKHFGIRPTSRPLGFKLIFEPRHRPPMADALCEVLRDLRRAQDRKREYAKRTDEKTGVSRQCFDAAL